MDLLGLGPNAALRSQGGVKWARLPLRDELVRGVTGILRVPRGSSRPLNFTPKRGYAQYSHPRAVSGLSWAV